MGKFLFLFSIGPVQSFIAKARKTQDLYAGSKILSELCYTAYEASEKNGDKIIFPARKDKARMSNRLLAITERDESNLKSYGSEIENQVRNKFKELAEKAFNKISKKLNGKPIGFDEQIDSHLEIYWAFYPIAGDSYTISEYKKAEKILGSVKNARIFKQLKIGNSYGEKGRKCSLDGEYNALFFGKNTNESYYKINIEKLNADKLNVDEIEIASNEGLSAVSFLKRFLYDETFPSTTKIAIYDCYVNHKEKFDDYKKMFGESISEENSRDSNYVKFNDQFYYKENITRKNIPNEFQYKIIKQLNDDLQKYLKDRDLELQKYYAILAFDGDSMGKWLGGDFLKIEFKQNAFEYHQKLSLLLMDFAAKAKILVEKNNYGDTIYAGGDDFLAFINLKYLFKTLKELRILFKQEVSDKLQSYLETPKELTFSAGVCISHYKKPLNIVLEKTRQMEEAAKDFSADKDCFAICSIKGSGEIQSIVWKNFADINPIIHNAELIEKIVYKLKKPNKSIAPKFSDNFVKNLRKEFAAFISGNKILSDQQSELFKIELKRQISRSCQVKNSNKRQEIDDFADILFSLLDQNKNIDNFLSTIEMCSFIQHSIN